MRRKRVSGATQEPLPRIKIPTFVGLLTVIIGFIASVLLVNVPALESTVASRPEAPLDAVLLQSSLDDVSAIVSPTIGLGGTTTQTATDFVTVEGRQRLDKQKRIELLLKGFSLMLVRHPQACLMIVGKGSLRPDLESFAAGLGISHAVIWTGFRQDIPRLLAAMDFIAFKEIVTT